MERDLTRICAQAKSDSYLLAHLYLRPAGCT